MKKEFELNEKKDDATNSAHNVKKNDIGSVFVVITMIRRYCTKDNIA